MTTPVGVGIIGTGRWARAHAAAATRSDAVHIVHCVSRSEATRSAFADEFAIPARSGTLGEMLADPSVEAVVIATPNDLHVPMAIEALAAAKPTLIDKPVAVSVAQGLGLLRAAGLSNRAAGVAHHPRKLAGQRFARQWLETGAAGVPRLAHANFSNARGGAMRPNAWHRTVAGSEAGVLIQVGIHAVDTLLWLLGPVTHVSARFAYESLGSDMPDAAVLTMQHGSGALSTVGSSWTTPGHYRLDIQATNGNLTFRLDHAAWTRPDVDDHAELRLERDGQPDEPITPPASDPLREQIDELAAAVRDATPMAVTIEEGIAAMAVVEAAVLSVAEGRAVALEELFAAAGAAGDETAAVLGPGAAS